MIGGGRHDARKLSAAMDEWDEELKEKHKKGE